MSDFTEHMKRRRAELGNISGETIARRAGISKNAYYAIESGASAPRMGSFQAIAEALELTPLELLSGVWVETDGPQELRDFLAAKREAGKPVCEAHRRLLLLLATQAPPGMSINKDLLRAVYIDLVEYGADDSDVENHIDIDTSPDDDEHP